MDGPAQCIEELINRLRDQKIIELVKKYFGVTTLSVEHAIIESVDKSTIRAYRNTQCYRPLSLYRSWAASETAQDNWSSRLCTAAKDIDSYREFHAELCCSLHSYWAHHDASSVPNYGRKRKLIDLFMKHILLSNCINSCIREKIRGLIHVPLDKYTLKHLSGALKEKLGIEIPPHKWTMGAVNENNYFVIQDFIRKVAQCADLPPIAFDIYAWNAEHLTDEFIKKWPAAENSSSGQKAPRDNRLNLKSKAHNLAHSIRSSRRRPGPRS